MPKAIHFAFHCLVPTHPLLLNPVDRFVIADPQSINLQSKAVIFHSSPLRPHLPHIRRPITCARKNKKGSGSQKLRRIFPKLLPFMVAYLKILPEPLDLVFGELVCGDGGRIGFFKGFGGGRFDGWRRKGTRNSGFLEVFLFSGLGLLLLLGRELKSDVFVGLLAFGLFGALLTKGYKRGVKDWVLGICFLGALMSFGFMKEDRQRLVERLRGCSPVVQVMKRKRRNGSLRD